jgi:hypothetical protein
VTASWESKYSLLQKTLQEVKASHTVSQMTEKPVDDETPSKRGRESDVPSALEGSSPNAKRIRVEEPIAQGESEIGQEPLADQEEELAHDEESADLLDQEEDGEVEEEYAEDLGEEGMDQEGYEEQEEEYVLFAY